MAETDDCIFCKIIKGEIPCAKVYEDENILAFLDLGQVTKGHTLVIPKQHRRDIFELDADTAAKLYQCVPMIAKALQATFNPIGLNILNNNGVPAGQTILHYHIHLIPRYGAEDTFNFTFTGHMDDYSNADRVSMADAIASHMSD
ncbi:MAG: HIT family protein [Sporolactobacillus sp.]